MLFLIVAFGNAWSFENRNPDENLGLALVALYQGDEYQATEYLSKSNSANARVILRKLKGRNDNREATIDIQDPTLICFYYYIKKLSMLREYRYFKRILLEIDKGNPNGDIGEPGLFYNAYFSPKATYLVIYSSRKTLLLRSATGELLETYSRGGADIGQFNDIRIIYSANESRRLKSAQNNDETFITCENARIGQVIWQKTMKNRADAYFSKDYRHVILINYNAEANLSDMMMSWLDIETGKILSQRSWRLRNYEQKDRLIAEYVAVPIRYFPVHRNPLLNTYSVLENSGRYSFTGNRTCGTFSLRRGSRRIRDLRFSSDVN